MPFDNDEEMLGADAMVSMQIGDDGQWTSMFNANIVQTAPAIQRTSLAAFRAAEAPAGLLAKQPYDIDELGCQSAVPDDFTPPTYIPTRQDVLPNNFDPSRMWAFDKK